MNPRKISAVPKINKAGLLAKNRPWAFVGTVWQKWRYKRKFFWEVFDKAHPKRFRILTASLFPDTLLNSGSQRGATFKPALAAYSPFINRSDEYPSAKLNRFDKTTKFFSNFLSTNYTKTYLQGFEFVWIAFMGMPFKTLLTTKWKVHKDYRGRLDSYRMTFWNIIGTQQFYYAEKHGGAGTWRQVMLLHARLWENTVDARLLVNAADERLWVHVVGQLGGLPFVAGSQGRSRGQEWGFARPLCIPILTIIQGRF